MAKANNKQARGNVGRLFINNVSIGTEVAVILDGGVVVRGDFMGIVRGLILVGTTFINPRDIAAFRIV